MNQPTQPNYINGLFITEKQFNNGGSILKVWIKDAQSLANQLTALAAPDGSLNLKIAKSKQPTISKKSGKVIATHTLAVDDWKPSQPAQQSEPAPF